jgi:hypothetical protein
MLMQSGWGQSTNDLLPSIASHAKTPKASRPPFFKASTSNIGIYIQAQSTISKQTIWRIEFEGVPLLGPRLTSDAKRVRSQTRPHNSGPSIFLTSLTPTSARTWIYVVWWRSNPFSYTLECYYSPPHQISCRRPKLWITPER